MLVPCGKSSLFPKHKRTLLVGKGSTFRLYAGALIERCFNAVLAIHEGLIMPAEAMSFLFCSGSCQQSTRNFLHTCETSTGSNTPHVTTCHQPGVMETDGVFWGTEIARSTIDQKTASRVVESAERVIESLLKVHISDLRSLQCLLQ